MAHVENLRAEQSAGRTFPLSELDSLEWSLLVAWHQAEQQFERRQMAQINQLVLALAKAG